MNAMPLNVAQQLAADRRASYEGAALRRRLRRLARGPVSEAQGKPAARNAARRDRVGGAPVPTAPEITIAEPAEHAPEDAPVGSVA
jgi:hypothetical protein